MYSKIALGNVKKSFKDYTIYFLTLTLAVCIFYTFNSIESQKAIIQMNSGTQSYLEMLVKVISYMSVFVSIILGGLILYASNFLIKKRKKELGIYMILGMGKGKISRILVLETLIVGTMSLISGLIVGIILSQGLSVFTSKLFDVSMSEYKFIISNSAIVKTILYFGIIFLLVMMFNTVIISRYKIIDLLTAGKKNENIKFKNPIVYLITFVLCLISLGYAYYLILKVGLDKNNPLFTESIGLGILGTLLFFFSLAGFSLYITKRSKKIYFKNLNIFVIKQLNSKINTNFISMTVICLMLFLTMGILSTGISLKNALESSLKDTTPFDATGILYLSKTDKVKSVEQSFKSIGFNDYKTQNYSEYTEYDLKDSVANFINVDKQDKKVLDWMGTLTVKAISISDYNELRKLENKETSILNDNEILITSNNDKVMKIIDEFLDNNDSVKIKEESYKIKNNKVIIEALHTTGIKDNIITVVVDDELVKNLEPVAVYFNVNFVGKDKDKIEKQFVKVFEKYMGGKLDYDKTGFVIGSTKEQVYVESKGTTTIVLFVGIYLGIVFLISSMAILALQQLSEASDSIDRYKALKKLGANDNMINKTIFVQTLIYFTLPIALAFVHAVVGIKVANDFIAMYNKPNIGASSLITALVFILVYLGYFYSTYVGYKNIIKNS